MTLGLTIIRFELTFRILAHKAGELMKILACQFIRINPTLLCSFQQNIEKHLHDLLTDERQRPGENIHMVRKHKWVLRVVKLLDLNRVIL